MNDDTPMMYTWYGQDVTDLSHQELLIAFRELAQMYHKSLEARQTDLVMFKLFSDARKRHATV